MKSKRLVALLLLVALLFSALPAALLPVSHADPADTVYVRKHVSLVYDNSGSMSSFLTGTKNLKWTYASYAAQIFAGLLNDTDSLTMTLMNSSKGVSKLEVDLAGDRQQQVDKILDVTNYAKGGTPFNSVYDAEQVLVKKGLLADSQIGDNGINQSEQFWLVLTTDGRFENGTKTVAEIETELKALLEKYSNLQLVYFGIGTKGDTSDQVAYDFRNSTVLTAYPNFTPVYAETEEQIVTTMQALANRISGRYSVSQGVTFNGNEVTVRVSGESSPIRNIAILAQKTNTQLLSAVDEDGKPLTVGRPANEQYPQNKSYDNVPSGTKGAHTALITCPDGKFPPGTVTLTFSEPVDPAQFSVMYEPAVYIKLTVQQKDASGNWVDIPYGQKVSSNSQLRVGYEICEDGTNTPIDAAKLPGVITDHITCGDQEVSKGAEFTAPTASTNITATVSMMDGAYTVSTVRSLQIIALDDYTFQVSDALTFYPEELATNSSQYIDFTILFQGAPAPADQMTVFSVDAGDLKGTLTTPKDGVYRFTPQQENRTPGEATISLCFNGNPVTSQKVIVKAVELNYSAQASGNLTMFSNEVASNQKPIEFAVTRTRNQQTGPLPAEEAGDFRIEAVNPDGHVLAGTTTFQNGKLVFLANGTDAQVGTYTVTLYRQDVALASASITILKYNAQFTAEVFRVGEDKVDWLDLRGNKATLAFLIYADGVPCTRLELEGMAGSIIQLQHDGPGKVMKLDVTIGNYNGQPALLVRPTSTAKNAFGAWLQKPGIAVRLTFGILKAEDLSIQMNVQAEKGTQISGTLATTFSAMDVIWFWIVLAIILFVLLCIIYLIICCIHKPRIVPGTLNYYKLDRDNAYYILKSKNYEKLEWKFSLNTQPEVRSTFLSMTLRAPENTASDLVCQSAMPQAVVSYQGRQLDNYFYVLPGQNTRAFLQELRSTARGNRILRGVVDGMMHQPVSNAITPPKPNETATYTPTLRPGAALIRRTDTGSGVMVEVWTYEARREQN